MNCSVVLKFLNMKYWSTTMVFSISKKKKQKKNRNNNRKTDPRPTSHIVLNNFWWNYWYLCSRQRLSYLWNIRTYALNAKKSRHKIADQPHFLTMKVNTHTHRQSFESIKCVIEWCLRIVKCETWNGVSRKYISFWKSQIVICKFWSFFIFFHFILFIKYIFVGHGPWVMGSMCSFS